MYRLLGLCLLLCASQVHAWGFTGHKAFCEAAYDLTSPKTQQTLDALAAKQGEYHSFAEACTWADDIKKDHQWDWSKHLHYVNIAHDDQQLTTSDCPQKGCVLSAIDEMQAKLKKDPQDWQALFFLAHFVGDLHQPMHVSYADDWGGNKTQVSFFGEPANLHGVWDYGIIEHLVGEDWHGWGDTLAATAKAKQFDASGTPAQWGDESLQLTRKIYSEYQPNQQLGQPYVDANAPIIEQRIERGAVRLAQMLDAIYQH
ncbi:S1/P1 nuclease [Shewanella sp. C32]|uniref:S1/P1 nuclease n=1 Tax=Shewanella electrica TaxID=515560 RepID=A0ABT2FQ67_9GAMM|nr:S1/P1 nuclease [Shewanella electrica]MCH1925774.1 S1/P1 nuclease [Shewanella electrica]MCS4557341.1 S1/P1 nuclease [Shewanella electrica]